MGGIRGEGRHGSSTLTYDLIRHTDLRLVHVWLRRVEITYDLASSQHRKYSLGSLDSQEAAPKCRRGHAAVARDILPLCNLDLSKC
jgi:hypothetical protein